MSDKDNKYVVDKELPQIVQEIKKKEKINVTRGERRGKK